MAEEKNIQEIKERPWVSYLIGVIILFIVGFFIFGGSLPWTKKGENKNQSPKQEVSVTIEGVIGEAGKDGSSFLINSASGFNNLIVDNSTKYFNEVGVETLKSSLKTGIRVRATGKPNGKSFEAKKITIVTEKPKVTPTPFNLPGTGIVE